MENKTIFFEKIKTKAGEMFALVPIKRIGTGILICAVIVGAGGVYWHQQRVNDRTCIMA